MTKNERTVAGIGLGLLALALLPQDARDVLARGVVKVVEAVTESAKKRKAFTDGEEVWEEIDVSDLGPTVH